jgi:RNA polymerase sigma-70 factor (ECF subfamily)
VLIAADSSIASPSGASTLITARGARKRPARSLCWNRVVADPAKLARFEQAVMPHFDAAYNLARWLTRSPGDADDVVQEAYLRAFTFFDGFRGGDAKAWLFSIVRNTGYSWLRKNRAQDLMTEFDETMHGDTAPSPEALQLRRADAETVRDALAKLPAEFREVLVLREMEELSYKEIADVTGIAIGTVMSRLSRARKRLHDQLVVPEESRT